MRTWQKNSGSWCLWHGHSALSLNRDPKLRPQDSSGPPGPCGNQPFHSCKFSCAGQGLPTQNDKPGKEF